MLIRRLRPDDAESYRALMLEGYELHPLAFTASVDERGPLPLAWWAARISDAADAPELVMGAFDGDTLVGVSGLRFEPRPKSRHKAHLYGMYVRVDATRHGVGERLVQAVLDAARARDGVRIVQLTVTEGNRGAEMLYQRCGFRAFGTEPFAMRTDDGYASKVHMWVDLQAPVPRA